jgi:menaquinone-dependent protoporphyrinogen oxidase
MTRILLACASRHGTTAEIAEEIGDVLRRGVPGAIVDVRDAAEPGDVDGYDAVVLGSAVYMGRWLPAAWQLVQGCQEILAGKPVWLFSSGPLGDPPTPLDELAEVETIRTAIGARDHRVFAGRLDRHDLRWTERVAARAVHAPGGDFRDHDAIRGFAADIAAQLLERPASS